VRTLYNGNWRSMVADMVAKSDGSAILHRSGHLAQGQLREENKSRLQQLF